MALTFTTDMFAGQAAPAQSLKVASAGKGWFARFINAMAESRQRAALVDIRRHHHAISEAILLAPDTRPSALPFNR
jgi:hypothetical protein